MKLRPAMTDFMIFVAKNGSKVGIHKQAHATDSTRKSNFNRP